MKSISVAIISLLISLNFSVLALDLDQADQTFHRRMIQRSPELYENIEINLLKKIPAQVEQVAAYYFVGLVNFAISYDLFNKGFEYKLNNDHFYEVTNEAGEAIAYTFSITITKDGAISTIGHYELHRRVDGIFYLSREPAWY